MKKIIIVGGGTAGWLSALVLNKFHKDSKITIIESSKIGILGAGEGSVPNFGAMLKMLDIKSNEFFKRTKSTLKNGLNFINWRGDGKRTQHLFSGENNFINPNNGFHFDARLVAGFFKEVALERGVIYIDGTVKGFTENEDSIVELVLDNGTTIDSDLIFDCSGFTRLILGKFLNEKWVSYNEFLKVNSAIAYFLPQENTYTLQTKTQTNMISMKCGWMWQAPLQHRWGCGYVFDDKYITEDEAKKEVEEYLGHEIELVKTFKYDAGSYEKSWVKNVIAIGLSYTFLEPLESTSIMSVIMQLKKLIDVDFDEKYKDKFNVFCDEVKLQNMIFVRYHYMCERNDTDFWRNYKNVPVPEELSKLIDVDGGLKINGNDEIYNRLNLKESTHSQLTFFYSNYWTIFKKNSRKFENNLI